MTQCAFLIPLGSEVGEAAEYDPDLLDDPQWPCGKHKRVLIFASYMVSVLLASWLRIQQGFHTQLIEDQPAMYLHVVI